MQVQAKQKLTYEEYLRLDAEAEEKREFYHGDLINMAGEQPEHAEIKANLSRALIAQEREGCRSYGEGTRVSAPGYGRGRYAYPDAYLACGPKEWDRSVNPPILFNPTLVIEVLSERSAAFDFGAKVEAYFRNESLQEYWVVAATHVLAVRHTRLESGQPLRHLHADLEGVLESEPLGLRIPLRQMYAGVIED